MQRSADRNDGLLEDIDQAFAESAFTASKASCAAFAIVRTDSREVVWANAAAAAFWGSRDFEDLARALFGPPEGVGRGWLGSLAGGFVPGRAPQLARPAVGRGLRMRDSLVLGRSWRGPGGESLMGFAVPQTGTLHDHPDDAWRQGATDSAGAPRAATRETHGSTTLDRHGAESSWPEGTGGPAMDLARRSQLAILRDRLNAAVDGTASLRLLWRTDRDDAITQIDDRTFARLGCPVRFARRSLAEVVAGFDSLAAERLRVALASRTTWSGISVRLPVADGALDVPIVLSASPMFDPDRTFAGYRGFGTIDLGQLGLALQGSRPVAAGTARDPEVPLRREPIKTPSPDQEPEQDEEPAAAPAAPLSGAIREPVPSAMTPASDQQADAPASPGSPGPSSDPVSAPQRGPSANVVHLRRIPAPMPVGSAGDAPHHGTAKSTPLEAGEPATALPTDELAFLALGDALRAQIDIVPLQDVGSETPQASPSSTESKAGLPVPASSLVQAASPHLEAAGRETQAGDGPAARQPVPDSSAASLIDQLPTALLVFVGPRPVAANRAASDLLDYAAPADLVQVGEGLVISGASRPDTGAATLRNARGEEILVEAAKVGIGWQGAAATLWTLVPHPRAAPRSSEGERPDGAEATAGDLLDHVDDAVALLDANGFVRRLNRRGESWFSRPGVDGIVGRSFMELLAPDSRATGSALLGEAGSQSRHNAVPLQREVLVRTADHVPLPMLLTMGRVGTSEFYATLRDLSELKRAETELARTARERERDTARSSDFLAKISHEIRTPLNAILGFAEVIMDERFGPLGNSRYKDYLRDIHASGTLVMTLVSDLLDLSRIQAGQLDLDVGAVDVNKIVTESVAQMQPEAHRERVIMRTSLNHRIPAVLVDERSARQIVQNLLSNAVKFNEPGGQVIVSTAPGDAGTVVLRVRDTGIGMTDAEIAAALEPFQQVSSLGPANGNGLGLPLTRALIGANGASMAIRSRPHEGTLVEVAFAAAMPEAARLPA